ncbi:MAG: membrane protein insertion efficiency factor YidD, partial [Planctomycetia bacterium]|nr:membrane protein insertion efficiency factor YidD [Planctomycetia bacterium]
MRTYQTWGRPLLTGHVQCRYRPSCSEYSIEAVQTHGIRHGLVLTWKRVSSCQTTVPHGTYDPVPELAGQRPNGSLDHRASTSQLERLLGASPPTTRPSQRSLR